mgnify:FL=1
MATVQVTRDTITSLLSPWSFGNAMARIVFTQQLARFIAVPEVRTDAVQLRAALDQAFENNPLLRGYVLDDQGHLRENVVIFIDGRRCTDRASLADPLTPNSMVYVLQALSGG